MAARPTWQGHLKLSLVTCPVALYTATSSAADVRFHLINPDTHNRIRMVPTDPDTGPVERSDLVRGYEVSKDEYVLFDDADDYFDDIPKVKADADMVEIAARIIAQKEADFDPTAFKDRYDDALREMIKAKTKGGKGLVDVAEPDDTNVIDLMAALKNSLKGSSSSAGKPAAKKKAASKSSARKKTA